MLMAYVRISDASQSEGRQLEAIRKYCPEIKEENIYVDKESGKDFERSAYKTLKTFARELES